MPKQTKKFSAVGEEYIYWCQFGRPAALAKTTLNTHKRTLTMVSKHFGSVAIEEMTMDHIVNLKKDMIDREAKLGYIIKVLIMVRSVLRYALEELQLDVMSWQRIKLPPRPRPEVKYLSQGEVDRVLSYIPTDTIQGIRSRAILTALLDTGMRISEVLSLNRDSIDWDDKSAFIIGKGSKKRKVLFQDWSLWWIRQYLAQRTDEHEALFVCHQNGYPIARIQQNDMQRVCRRIGKKAGVEKFTPHMARKTAGSTMWNNGADIQDVQVFLGHEKIQTTQIYVGKNYERVKRVQEQTLQYRAASDTGMVAVMRWAKAHDRCVVCGTNERPHAAKGHCYNCYVNLRNAIDREKRAKAVQKPVHISI